MTSSQSVDTLTGRLDSIRYQNDRGFLIGSFIYGDEESTTALGNLLRPKVGLDYKLNGKWVDDHRWGRQFRFSSYEPIKPKSTDGIFRYLMHTIKWIGPVTAADIIQRYGETAIDILRDDPDKVVSDIRGISPNRAKEIQEALIENEQLEAVVVELEALIGEAGLRRSLPIEIAERWGADSIVILRENPYRLIDFRGVGFLSADHIATTRFKINTRDVNRQKAGLLYLLNENEIAGNVWFYVDELYRKAQVLLGCDPSEGFQILKDNEHIVQVNDVVSQRLIAEEEAFIAEKLRWMMGK